MTHVDLDINVHHVTRLEGHGNITVNVRNGAIEKCQWEVVEAPRFFEAMARGRDYTELCHLTSRICGICSIGHSLTSLQATEDAMGVDISEQTRKLRKLILHGENLQSHVLHACYLALPDFAGVGSVIPMVGTHREAVLTVVKLHRLANDMCDLIGGRTTHPISLCVGGFTKLPAEKDLEALKQRLANSVEDWKSLVPVLQSVAPNIPQFERETEYIGLVSDDEYALYEGDIGSTDTGRVDKHEYRAMTNEYVVPHSTAKYTKHNRESYAVGALARFNLNHDKLTDLAKEVAGALGLAAPCHNPYMNSIAQVVESVDSTADSIRLIDELLGDGIKPEEPAVEVKAGRGVGAVEVPRGILFHEYEYDDNGTCLTMNGIIPTNQNHANIQKDMEALVPTVLDQPKERIELLLEMLVRSYDPCISCSTHYLHVEFVE